MAAELMAAIDDWIAQRENPPEATLLESGLLKTNSQRLKQPLSNGV
ncbi:MAG: hypothetical protein CM15mP68_4880 [Pseudomonadota bacterium]|nr:MAG: hypothetical protein CM15mP68_4880 [Pseudomonadota bacterium]